MRNRILIVCAAILLGLLMGQISFIYAHVRLANERLENIQNRLDGVGTFVVCQHYGGTVRITDLVEFGQLDGNNTYCDFGDNPL